MLQKFFKYHGAGNDFLLADNREGYLSLSRDQIRHLCDRHTGFGADGVMLLEKSLKKDFRMVFYNPDGSGGMMCGNGGRCIVAFAADLGVVSGNFPVEFEAPDGFHTAVILSEAKNPGENGYARQIRLKMKEVTGVKEYPDDNSFFLDTGTRHLVKFVKGLDDYPVKEQGRILRQDPRFAPEGTNVNFVEPVILSEAKNLLRVRTFEKGVEDETLACGTGIVATAIAASREGIPGKTAPDGRVSYDVRASISDLKVDFIPSGQGSGFQATDVWLTGPAEIVGTVECFL
jgi:diaminopimelate epimerase